MAVADILDTARRRQFLLRQRRIFDTANAQEAAAKEQEGQQVTFLGRRVDAANRSIAVLPSSLFNALFRLHTVVLLTDAAADPTSPPGIDTVSHRWLDKLAGIVQWVAEGTYEGRLYTRALWHAVDAASQYPAGPRLAPRTGLADACRWWIARAASGTLRAHTFVPLSSVPQLTMARILPTAVVLQTDGTRFPAAFLPEATPAETALVTVADASGKEGWAVVWRGKVMAGRWLASQTNWGIGSKELWPFLVLIRFLGPLLRGMFVAFGTDNVGNALLIDGGNPTADTARGLIQELYSLADTHGFHFVAWWIPRSCNVICDLISKCTSRTDACRVAETYGLEMLDKGGTRPASL